MERLWSAAGTAALVIGVIVFNAIRYPAVSEMVGPQASAGSAEKPAAGDSPSAPAPAAQPHAWTNDFAPIAPSNRPSAKVENAGIARAPAPLPLAPTEGIAARQAVSPDVTRQPGPVPGGELSWPAENGAPPRDVRDPHRPDERPALEDGGMVPVVRTPGGAAGTALAGGVQRLPRIDGAARVVDLQSPLADGTTPRYPTAGK